MNSFVMLAGIPGSGKSYFAEEMGKSGYVVCSSDEIRKRLYRDINDQEHNNEVFRVLHEEIINHLKNGENVIYDACNINSKRRRSFMKMISDIDCRKECFIITVPYDIAIERNANRKRTIPVEVIDRMYKNWQTPATWEGFDNVEVICDIPGHEYDVADYVNYDQNNPHHNYTLGIHMVKTAEYIKSKTDDYVLYQAALRHDSGKPFCEFNDEDGVSHYYGHAGVGAWDTLSDYSLDNIDCLKVSQLISYHMMPLTWKDKKSAGKYKNIWGDEFFKQIVLLSKADRLMS